jgi:hypothetical protein
MIIFAVDPGATSGWAAFDPGMSLSGSIDHETAAMEDWWDERAGRGMKAGWAKFQKEERLKRVLGKYEAWLESCVRYWQPAVLVAERQSPQRAPGGRKGWASNSSALEFRGATLGVAGRMDLALTECWPAQWRKLLNGRPYDPAKDHKLAAEMMLAWWQTEQQTMPIVNAGITHERAEFEAAK